MSGADGERAPLGAPGEAPGRTAPTAAAPTTADAATLAWYDGAAADYDAWSAPFNGGEDGTLARFLAGLPAGARVIDLGCGAGHAAAAMMAAGLSVRALDASAGLVSRARARGVPAEVGRFETLEDVAAYDGAWISFSLLHAPLASWPDVLARVARALRPGGLLFLGLKEGEGERRDRLGRRYAYIREPGLRALLAQAGFAEIEVSTSRGVGRDGAETGLLAAFARLA
ncbi:class I SAM-dependent methyltransferase [Albimonas sp. CAU 1670]|uniref:methyltransferase domain-containing protein n=1 Tax=Albimonas sp. CAU 1670 TaxID=3032599 RepID=UPI0023DA0061|nr:class I SAM-dependent methyltransferase [Albimonas sp. CAU 1670]MDF2233310.1 class I SAM-dependent methyltransferase [Albimonas sp. CAU 1670]